MRGQREINSRLLEIEEALLQAAEQRQRQERPDPEQDMYILSLLDQMETLLWVLEEGTLMH